MMTRKRYIVEKLKTEYICKIYLSEYKSIFDQIIYKYFSSFRKKFLAFCLFSINSIYSSYLFDSINQDWITITNKFLNQ